MTIGTPTIVGSIGTASATSLSLTTAGAIAAHDLVILAHYCAATTGALSAPPTDSSGNTYTKVLGFFGSAPSLEVYACFDAIAMASSNSISGNFGGAVLRHGFYVINVTGMVNSFGGCYDPHTGTNASVERSTATSSPSTAILNSSAAQMAIFGFTAAGATLGTFTPGGSFTALTALTTNAFMYPYYQILAANTPLSTAPSWVNSVSHINLSCGFIGIPATTKNRQSNLALTGVGA